MKKLVLAVLVLLVVLIAAVLIGPSFINWNGYKAEIAEAVESQTGRRLEINGDISLQILPAPRLSVEDLKLSNVEGGNAPSFVSAGALQIHVALAPLLQGKVQVASVTLKDPVIALEQFADGSNNWTFETGGTATDSSAASESASAGATGNGSVDLSLDGATIENGNISFLNHADGTQHSLNGINAELSADSLDGPFKLTGDLDYKGLPIGVSMATGRIDARRATALEAIVKIGDTQAEASFSGTAVLADAPRLRGTVALSAKDLPAALDALAPLGVTPGSLPPALDGPAKLTARLEGGTDGADLQDLVVSVAGLSAKGAASAVIGEQIAVDAKLAFDRFSLDNLIADFAPGSANAAKTSETASAPSSGSNTAGAFALPANIDASLALSADAIDYRGGVIRQPFVELAMADGVLLLDVLSAQMPGGSDLTVSGALETVAGKPQFSGRADFVSDNLRSALSWLGTELDGVAPDRVRKGSIGTDITATPEQIQLTNWVTELDTTRIRGGLTLLLRERPAFGLALDLGKLNLDAYLPPEAADQGTAHAGQSEPAAGADTASPLQQAAAALNSFDANVRVSFEEILYRKTRLLDGALDATIQNGALTVRELSVADLGGAKIKLNGSLAGSVADPNTKLQFDIDAKSVARLARLAGIEPDETLQRIGALKLSGSILGDLSALTVDATAQAVGAAASVKGVVQPLAEPLGIDLALKLQHPNADQLISTLAPGALPSSMRTGAFAAATTIVSQPDGTIALDATVDLVGGELGLKGTVSPSQSPVALALDTKYSHPDVVALIRGFVADYDPAKRDLGPVTFASRIEGTSESLAIGALKLGAGPVSLNGSAQLALSGARPKLTLSAEAGAIDLDPWLPKDAPRPVAAVAPAVPAKSGAWSREDIDTSGLLAADADIGLTAEQVKYGAYILDNLDLKATLEDGVLTVSRLASGFFGGTFESTAALRHAATPTAELNLTIKNADVEQAAKSAADAELVTGTLNYETKLKTTGRNEYALVSGLQGDGTITVTDGTVEGFDLPAVSEQLKALDRSADFLSLAQKAMQGGTTPFDSLTATYKVTDGVLRSEDISLKSATAEGRGTAIVNLPPQEMDVQTRFWLSEHPNSPPIGLRIVGPLDTPRHVLDANKMQAYVLQRIVERGILRQFNKTSDDSSDSSSTGSSDSSSSEKLTPEKALQGVLKGLLGN